MKHEDDGEDFDATDDGTPDEVTDDERAEMEAGALDVLAEAGWPTDG